MTRYRMLWDRSGRWVRLILPFCLFALLPSTAAAQVGEYRTDFAVGVNGGYTLSNVAFVPKVPQGMLGSPTFGLTARLTSEKYFNSICAIVAELNYATIGWKENILDYEDQPTTHHDDPTLRLEYQRKISYVQIPFLARMGWGRERKGMQFFFQVGPQFGVYLSDKVESNFDVRQSEFNPGPVDKPNPDYRYGDGRVSDVVAQDTMAIENKFDYGIAVGLGLEFSHRKVGHFLVEGRYYYGLGNMYGSTKRDYFARSNFGNIVIKFAYLFDIIRTKNSKIK